MAYDPIEKKEDMYSKKPNLMDYEGTYKDFNWDDQKGLIEYFDDGKLNAAYNAVSRHAKGKNKDKKALIWEDDEGNVKEYTYDELDKASNKFANVLGNLKIGKGERVFLFLPRIPEVYMSFLGILKAGVICGTLFAAFGENALKDRLENSEAIAVITTPELKERVDKVWKDLPNLKYAITVGCDCEEEKCVSFEKEMEKASDEFDIVHTDPEDSAFMLYTSGTTGKPKGVMHAHAAILQQTLTAMWALDIHEDDMYWCTADPGWVTGISYTILGPWSAGVTSFVHGGRLNPERWYQLLEKYKINVWYTAPTAVRMLMSRGGDDLPKKFDLSNLRFMASVGEPLNPEAVKWGNDILGRPFHDNWWQTECGAIMISNYAMQTVRPGSMGKPFPGITAAIVDDEGKEVPVGEEGNLAVKPGWPSMMRTIWKNEKKYDSYFPLGKDKWYFSGDKARMDEDGYFWFIGRADDVIKTAGERVGPFEVESTLVEHPDIAEAGVIGKPDELRGEIIKAFIKLKPGVKYTKELEADIKKFVKARLAGHAYPREIEVREKLPKTRSGKIVRRILKAEEMGEDVGDTSTLEDY